MPRGTPNARAAAESANEIRSALAAAGVPGRAIAIKRYQPDDEAQLAKNEVPVFAASYAEDMYVDIDLSLQTAKKIKNCKVFTTNVMFHNAVSRRMEEVVKQVFNLRDDVIE